MSITAYRVVITFFCCLLPLTVIAQSPYEYGSDSQRQDGVPQGVVTKHVWDHSKVFPGTVRDYWIYVPAQYDKSKPACLMIFNDGGGYVRENGHSRVPIVFDNLIHKKEMPVTIGLFINPGVIPIFIESSKEFKISPSCCMLILNTAIPGSAESEIAIEKA